jgi:hypothetical protein
VLKWLLAIAGAALAALAAWTMAVRHAVQTAKPLPPSKAEVKAKAEGEAKREAIEQEDKTEKEAIDNASKSELIDRARRRAVDGMRGE